MRISNKKLLFILGLIILICVGAYFAYVKFNINKNEETIVSKGMQMYRNNEFGFEFQYPIGWTMHENTFGSPFSKFNLVSASPEENNAPNPIIPSFLINIVTPEFAERAVQGFSNGKDIMVAERLGKIYEYEFEGFQKIAIDITFGQYHILFGTTKQYENTFNNILSSFRFIK